MKQAKLKVEADDIEHKSELATLLKTHEHELAKQTRLTELELEKAKQLAQIEAAAFETKIKALGPSTIQKIAAAGPELQRQLLRGLGVQSFILTDQSQAPVNVFANGAQPSVMGGAGTIQAIG